MSELADSRIRKIKLEIKGTTYTLTELSVSDLADFEEYVLSRRLAQFRKASEGMDDTERLRVMGEMVSKGIPDMEVTEEMNTMDGTRFMLHRALVKEHPELTLDDMGGIADLSNLAEVATTLMSLGSSEDESPPAIPPAETTEA